MTNTVNNKALVAACDKSGQQVQIYLSEALEGSKALRKQGENKLDKLDKIMDDGAQYVADTRIKFGEAWDATQSRIKTASSLRLAGMENVLAACKVLSPREFLAMSDEQYATYRSRAQVALDGATSGLDNLALQAAAESEQAVADNHRAVAARGAAGTLYFADQKRLIDQVAETLKEVGSFIDKNLQEKAKLVNQAVEAYVQSAQTLTDFEAEEAKVARSAVQQDHDNALTKTQQQHDIVMANRRIDMEEKQNERESERRLLAEKTAADAQFMRIELEKHKFDSDRRLLVNTYYRKWYGWWHPYFN